MDERLRAFLAKGKEYEIEGQKLELKPFKGKQLDLLMNMSEKPTGEDVRNLVAQALTTSGIPTTLEDTEELSIGFINKVAEYVMDVNGFNIEK